MGEAKRRKDLNIPLKYDSNWKEEKLARYKSDNLLAEIMQEYFSNHKKHNKFRKDV